MTYYDERRRTFPKAPEQIEDFDVNAVEDDGRLFGFGRRKAGKSHRK